MIDPATARFLSLVSHEFRTPLTVIQSSCDLLESYGDRWENDRRISHYRRIQSAVVDMTALLENTALLASFDAMGYRPTPERLVPGPFLGGLLESARSMAPDRTIESSWEPESMGFPVDQRLLQASVANLLSNALRFSGGPVEVGIAIRDSRLEVRVRDRGPGIAEEDRDRIWQPFERGAGTSGIPGVGLGLAIVARGTALCGGSAALLPRDGGGIEAVLSLEQGVIE